MTGQTLAVSNVRCGHESLRAIGWKKGLREGATTWKERGVTSAANDETREKREGMKVIGLRTV